MGAGSESTVHRRKSAPPDPLDPAAHDPRAAQAADVLGVDVTSVAVATAGLPRVLLHRRAKLTASRARDDLAVPHQVAMLVRARVLGATSVAMTGVVATAIVVNVVAVAPPRAKAAAADAVDVVVAAAVKSTTKCRPPAVSSTTSMTGINFYLSQSG